MVSGYFGHLESNLRWYFSDVLPGGTFRVSHEPGRGQRPEEGRGRGMNPELRAGCVLDIQILSPLLTRHNHSFSLHSDITSSPDILQVITENTTARETARQDTDCSARGWKWYSWTEEKNISLIFFLKFYSSTSGIIDKHDETLALNKLFWDKKSLGNIKRPAPATRLIHSVYFRKKLQVWNCERRTYVQSPKSTLSSLKDVCRRVFIIYSSCNSLLFDLWWWLDDFVWIMAVKICGSPSLDRVQSPPAVDGGSPGAREIPPHPSRPSHLSDPQSGLWLTQTCLLGVSRWPGGANSQSSANNIPRGIIIPSSQCKRISLIHIIQNHNKTLLQLTASQYYPRVPGK